MQKKNNKKIDYLFKDVEFVSQTKKAIHFAKLGDFISSEKIYKELISKGKYDHLTLHRLAAVSLKLRKKEEFLNYLQESIKFKKDYAQGYGELGNYFFSIGQIESALNYYLIAVRFRPDLYGAYINIGNIFAKLGRTEEALKNYKQALIIKNDLPLAHYNIGNILLKNKDFEQAEKSFLKVLRFDNENVESKIGLINIYLQTANINSLKKYKSFIKNVGLKKGGEINRLMQFFYLDSSPEKQFLRAKNFCKKKFGDIQKINEFKIKKENKKIKIAYISANFNDHPVSKVMEPIFAGHDKTIFELYAYSLSDNEDEVTKTLKKYFHSFKILSSLPLKDVLNKIRSDKLDIAVDLMGYTRRNRIEIFNERIAPIQINYLGFPGTTCIPNLDFLIADKYVIPRKYKKFYSENVIYMPNSYINSVKYEYSNSEFVSKKQNLPPNVFLLAAFHNTLKLSEEVIKCWIGILKQSENTYLWLKEPNKITKKNLLSYFHSNNIDLSRILFAERVDNYNEHVSRYSQADLFLDTFQYNGHSTLVECVWSELPFITLVGESFASRVGTSILNSLDLRELITYSEDEYIEKVLFFIENVDQLLIVKDKIKRQKKDGDFFNQNLFVKQLERKFIELRNSFK